MSMRKNSWKAKGPYGDKWRELNLRKIRAVGKSLEYDQDAEMFFSMAQELKEEGNRLFLKRDYEDALIKYDKAIKLLPKSHVDVASIRSNMAECYMQMGINEYPFAIQECNLALEVEPGHSKALLKRARCYEALDRLDLALKDIQTVLEVEPNNHMASDTEPRLKRILQRQGSRVAESPLDMVASPKCGEPQGLLQSNLSNGISMKMRSRSLEEGKGECNEVPAQSYEREMKDRLDKCKSDLGVSMVISKDPIEENNTEDKVVVEEKIAGVMDGEPKRTMKLVFREDIRLAQVPLNCNILKLRQIISERFPTSKDVLIKYKDEEGDLVTITTTGELRLAEAFNEHGLMKLFLYDVRQNQDPLFQKNRKDKVGAKHSIQSENSGKSKGATYKEYTCMSDWIIQFAHFFKNFVGFDIDAYIDIHELGIKLFSEAMEDIVTSEEAQDLLNVASDKFLEMASLALFNCGNVRMSKARKKVYYKEGSSDTSVVEQINCAYDWAQNELATAGRSYEEALEIKPNLYEAVFALGQQQFEQAKLAWYYAVGNGVCLDTWPAGEVLTLYNNAEENIERGMQMWEEAQQRRLRERYKKSRIESLLQKMKLDGLCSDMSAGEVEEQATNFRSQILVLWGTILYERSVMEFKLGIPVWHECLEAAIEKFELAGASKMDIGVMKKNHCSNDTTFDGMGFSIDEIVQAWNEMYEAKKWQHNISSFRLEPLLRRRVSKIYNALGRR